MYAGAAHSEEDCEKAGGCDLLKNKDSILYNKKLFLFIYFPPTSVLFKGMRWWPCKSGILPSKSGIQILNSEKPKRHQQPWWNEL